MIADNQGLTIVGIGVVMTGATALLLLAAREFGVWFFKVNQILKEITILNQEISELKAEVRQHNTKNPDSKVMTTSTLGQTESRPKNSSLFPIRSNSENKEKTFPLQ